MIDYVSSPVQQVPSVAPQNPLRDPVRFLSGSAPWRAFAYLAVSMLLGWAVFFLYVVVVLLPFAPAWSYGLAKIERVRVTWMGEPEVGDPHPPITGGLSERAGARLGERATWREVAYSLILAVVAPFVFVGAAIGWAVGVGLLFQAFLSLSNGPRMDALGETVVENLAFAALGAVVCVIGLYITYGVSVVQVGMAKLLLGPTEEELQQRVSALETSRGVLVHSFEDERRRIERNLHDGPQQDLASLSLQLGELQQTLAANPVDESVSTQVVEAQARLERAMAGLRDTVRGVHPQVLDDMGVEAACRELGGGPLQVDVVAGEGWVPGWRLPVDVERAMYYTASEAVTNAIKHGGATRVSIAFTAEPPAMTVMDDGSGGADVTAGTGLAGLVERAESIGATLTVLSPVGGPTTLHWQMP